MLPNSWFKKEMAMRGLSGFGGGATGLANAGGCLLYTSDAADE